MPPGGPDCIPQQRFLGKGLDAGPRCNRALADQGVDRGGLQVIQRSQQQRRRGVDIQRSVGGQQRDPGFQSTQVLPIHTRQQTQLAELIQDADLTQRQWRQFKPLKQASPTIEGHLVDPALA